MILCGWYIHSSKVYTCHKVSLKIICLTLLRLGSPGEDVAYGNYHLSHLRVCKTKKFLVVFSPLMVVLSLDSPARAVPTKGLCPQDKLPSPTENPGSTPHMSYQRRIGNTRLQSSGLVVNWLCLFRFNFFLTDETCFFFVIYYYFKFR